MTDAKDDDSIPTLFLMVGLPGVGKTTAAREIAARTSALRLSPDEWLIPLIGENDGPKRDIIEGRFVWLARNALRARASVVLDFGLWARDERMALRAIAQSEGAQVETVYLALDPAEQLRRVKARWTLAPETTFEITIQDLTRFDGLFEPPDQHELDSSEPGPPPGEFESWDVWAAQRWPSSHLCS